MKRLAVGVVVVVLLALGAGMFANLGTTVAGPVAHHPATSKPKLRPGPARMAATPSTATPHALAPAARHTLNHRPATTRSATTVQIVDPASVSLPAVGPVLLLNPNTAASGATLNVLGSGFDRGKLVTLTLATGPDANAQQGGRRLDTAQAGRDGTFGKNVGLPTLLPGHTFWVIAQERNGDARAVARGSVAIGSPTATLSTAAGKPGDNVYASARGFDPNEAIDVYLNNLGTAPVATLHAGSGGGLSLAAIPVPYGPVGPTALLLLGRRSRGLAAIPFEMLGLYPTGSVSSYAAVADTVLSFSTSGFGPDEDVDVRVNTPDGFAVGKLHTDSGGIIRNAGRFRIPFSLKGRNTFVLTGEQSHTSTTVTFTVEPYQPIAAPSSYGGGPGTAITFYSTGFARRETVRVWESRAGGGRTQVATMRTDRRGNLVARAGLILIKTDEQPGKLTFTLAGDKSVTPVTVPFNVQSAGNGVSSGTTGASGGQ